MVRNRDLLYAVDVTGVVCRYLDVRHEEGRMLNACLWSKDENPVDVHFAFSLVNFDDKQKSVQKGEADGS